jgi:NADH pyrophosphatase NudC (nudix superfamily)
MFDRVTVIETIDRAYDEQRFCAACGAPTILRNDGDVVVLQCSDIGGAGILTRIGHFLMPHTLRIVIDLSEAIAA